jgi:hypothetical protein
MLKRPAEKLRRQRIRFLSEQDGPIERKLKTGLTNLFGRDKGVSRAYLVALDYGNPNAQSVALCLRTLSGPDVALIEEVQRVFSSLFGPNEHLDIVFISNEQEIDLMNICNAFFARERQ